MLAGAQPLDGAAPCPEGTTRSATLLEEDFTRGVPHPDFNGGWGPVSGAVDGPAARSAVGAAILAVLLWEGAAALRPSMFVQMTPPPGSDPGVYAR